MDRLDKEEIAMRIKTFPKLFWGVHSLNDKRTFVYFFPKETNVKEITVQDQPSLYKICETPLEGCKLVAECNKHSRPAICYAYNPVSKQSEVVSFSEVGVYANFTRIHKYVQYVEETKRNIFPNGFSLNEVQTTSDQPVKVDQVIKADKNDPLKMVVRVHYPNSSKVYTFRCRQWHLEGEKVCVFTNDEYTNVTVVETIFMKESEIIALARSLNREDLNEIYCEYTVEGV